MMSVTFSVADVEKGDKVFDMIPFLAGAEKHLSSIKKINIQTKQLPGYIQKFSCRSSVISPHNKHGFISTVFEAYCHHLPLSFSPDHIWNLVLQGLAQHIHLEPEKYRPILVEHQGKKTLTVRDETASLESENNNWEGFISSISEQIETHIGSFNHHMLVPTFSTTNELELLIHNIGLMDTVSDYFEYRMLSICGIPTITLEGEPNDWLKIIEHAEILTLFELEDWYDAITNIVKQCHKASLGHVDVKFWRDIFHRDDDHSGGPYISGWVLDFLPYIYSRTLEDSKALTPNYYHPMTWEHVPTNVTQVPVKWEGTDTVGLTIYAGCFGMSQSKDLTLRPELGWLMKRS